MVFLFIWQFCVPEAICIFAYWKILKVILRQRKVKASTQQQNQGSAMQPVAGTSDGMSMATYSGSTNDKSQTDKEFSKVALASGSKGHREQGIQNTFQSQAKLNIIKTMIYIVVCFTVCIMPRSVYMTYVTLKVKNNRIYLYSRRAGHMFCCGLFFINVPLKQR